MNRLIFRESAQAILLPHISNGLKSIFVFEDIFHYLFGFCRYKIQLSEKSTYKQTDEYLRNIPEVAIYMDAPRNDISIAYIAAAPTKIFDFICL